MTSAIPDIVERASFTFYSEEDIKKISVKHITDSQTFQKGGIPSEDGLYSPDLGPLKRGVLCTTCGQTDFSCLGHFGHIELSVPVFHPVLLRTLYQILDKCCLECHHFRLPLPALKLFLAQIECLNYGFEYLVDELDQIATDFVRDKPRLDEALAIVLEKRLDRRIEEEKTNTGVKNHIRPQLRSVVEKRMKLFRGFINNKLIKPLKNCEKCTAKKLTLSVVNQAVIAFSVPKKVTQENKRQMSKLVGEGDDTKSGPKDDAMTREFYVLQGEGKKYLTPLGAKYHIHQVWLNERKTMQKIFHFLNLGPSSRSDSRSVISKPIDTFFLTTLFVEPSRFRPVMSRQGQMYSGPRTSALSQIMEQSITVQELMKQIKEYGLDNQEDFTETGEVVRLRIKLASAWQRLQTFCNRLYDNEMDKYRDGKYPGLKQLIDKKQGLFRKNMMGKRVNFAARSVISPDPNIRVDEIGVPLVFATRLTYPQPVTPWNIESMREAVLNGPTKHPGAVCIQYEDGTVVRLKPNDLNQRKLIANRLRHTSHLFHRNQDGPEVMLVQRHLISGDVLLFNRQPTLHKPSIMAFKARVLPNEKGFRLHYANCKCFNADFDGDEMNAHFPQNEIARSEAYNIASVNYQYLVPKDGSPLGGLIQDHIVATCLLTKRDHFFRKDLYQQLVFAGLSFLGKTIKLLPPTIIKPEILWTGKQVITTIILNCMPDNRRPPTLTIGSKIGAKIFKIPATGVDMSDCNVIIRHGELLVGFIDKANIGATHYGLVHMCYELYGGETSSNLMSAFSRLATIYLQIYEGFTLGIHDILCENEANEARQKTIRNSVKVGDGSAAEALGLEQDVDNEVLLDKLQEAHSSREPGPMKQLDNSMKSRTDKIANEISSRCLPEGLLKLFPDNNLQMMIHSGAKGGTVNALQISCLLGQIELEGRRVPLSMSGRTLPSFAPYDTSPKAGGFVSGRFLTGIRPQEFFFHCMAGREGLIDTAVKTSRSGYLQRCLIKHLEGLIVHYDQTVRDSCGSVIQFLYGEDGLDVLKSQLLKPKALALLVDNYKIIAPSQEERDRYHQLKELFLDELEARQAEIDEWVEVNGTNRVKKLRGSGFLDYLNKLLADFRERQRLDSEERSVVGSTFYDTVFDLWYGLSFKEKRKWNKFWCPCPDPIISALNPVRNLGSIPEKLDTLVKKFVRTEGENLVLNETEQLMPNQSKEANRTDSKSRVKMEARHQLREEFGLLPKVTRQEFYELVNSLFMKMSAQPGEAVGLLAAQSIGEPSTQMTLNTFHFAGRGEMNVTLGIPRLREILMTASPKIGTPSMDIPFLAEICDETGQPLDTEAIDAKAQHARRTLNAVRLSDVLEYVDIRSWVEPDDPNMVSGKTGPATTRGTGPVTTRSTGPATRSGGATPSSASKKKAVCVRTGRKNLLYKVEFNLLPSKYYRTEFKTSSSRVLEFIETKFAKQLLDTMKKQLRRLANANELFEHSLKKTIRTGERQKEPETGENDQEEDELEEFNKKAEERRNEGDGDLSSSDEEEEDVEGGTDTTKVRSRRDQELEYEDPEEDDLEVDGEEAQEGDNDNDDQNQEPEVDTGDEPGSSKSKGRVKSEPGRNDQQGEDGAVVGGPVKEEEEEEEGGGEAQDDAGDLDVPLPNMEEPREGARDKPEKIGEEAKLRRITKVKQVSSEHVVAYDFDTKRERWCHITYKFEWKSITKMDMGALIEAEAKKTYVYRVGNIHRALLVKDVNARNRGANYEMMIKTEGVSLLSLVRFGNLLDLNAVYSNDIHAIANTYGIEAASQAIRREIANVFAVYGIGVDPRHLSLIADYMTYNGTIRGMNRMSMEASASPLQQMTFESTANYLKSTTLLGFYDDIKSPSAKLIFGRPTLGGTGLSAALTRPPTREQTERYGAVYGLSAVNKTLKRRLSAANAYDSALPVADASWPDSRPPSTSPGAGIKVEPTDKDSSSPKRRR